MFSEITHSLIQHFQYLLFMFFSEEAEVYMGSFEIFRDLYASDGDEVGFKRILDRVYKNLTENFFDEAWYFFLSPAFFHYATLCVEISILERTYFYFITLLLSIMNMFIFVFYRKPDISRIKKRDIEKFFM